ncbi:hypothetical protein HPB48_001355 [Haemaphysalis longicornis]|uniref:THAP-type domain-containing protein n=1 Tax=Haemaphysalis longicornis TaxID=44386 RepID=A0A9J6FFR1_HAELO|nr:hypothetical protein HPB48_001355 [Haemaphysalis longicornis]
MPKAMSRGGTLCSSCGPLLSAGNIYGSSMQAAEANVVWTSAGATAARRPGRRASAAARASKKRTRADMSSCKGSALTTPLCPGPSIDAPANQTMQQPRLLAPRGRSREVGWGMPVAGGAMVLAVPECTPRLDWRLVQRGRPRDASQSEHSGAPRRSVGRLMMGPRWPMGAPCNCFSLAMPDHVGTFHLGLSWDSACSQCSQTARKCRRVVCESHFKAEDIVRETSYIDQATGRTVTATLSRLRLRADAVPTVFPGCPSYLSIDRTRREDPESKRMRLEATSLEKVLAESILTAKKEDEADKLCDLKDVANFIRGKKLTFWHVIECNEHVILAHICNDEAPWIKYSVVVKTDLTLTVNFSKNISEAARVQNGRSVRGRQQTTAAGVVGRSRGVRQCPEFKL